MTPMDAYHVLSEMHHDLAALRMALYPGSLGYSHREIEAQVIAFEALRRMEENESANIGRNKATGKHNRPAGR